MNLMNVVKNYWHIPTSTIAFQKYLLEKRDIRIENNLDMWKEKILNIEQLDSEEQELLEVIIKRIDSKQEVYTIEVLFGLIKDTTLRYYKGKYVLIKYLQCVTYEDSWNEWYRQARGVVINLNKMEVASATLPKFFNVNEKLETSLATVMSKSKNGNVTKYIKQDGSCVSVSYKDGLIITTPGSFESKQTEWANGYLKEKHSDFLKDFRTNFSNLTFIFEYVGPENRIVVVYPKTDMILLQIIDSNTGKIYSVKEMIEYAEKYNFNPCETVEMDFDEMINLRDNKELFKAEEQEGWVIRIDKEDETFMTKLKCSDYVNMHKMISNALNPKWVFESIVNDTYDDLFSQLESDEVRKIVEGIASKIQGWGENKKKEFQSVYNEVPNNMWMNEETLQNSKEFNQFVLEKTEEIEKKDKVKQFLYQFAKGKLKNPKEEILEKARMLYKKNILDLSKLEDFDAYKTFISYRTKELLKEVEVIIDEFVKCGKVNEKYREWLQNEFGKFSDMGKEVENLEGWLETFKEKENEFLRLAQVSKENLRPEQFKIHEYAKMKLEFENLKKEKISVIKKECLGFLLRENNSVFLQNKLKSEFIIDDELYRFHLEKQAFENETVCNIFPNEEQDNINRILKEFYLMARGNETDNSYGIAKEIFKKMPEKIKNQKEYFKEKGKFSGYVNKNIKSFYRQHLFDLFEKDEREKQEYIREINFIPRANVVVDESKEKLTEFDIDFKDMREFTKNMAINE